MLTKMNMELIMCGTLDINTSDLSRIRDLMDHTNYWMVHWTAQSKDHKNH